MGTHHQLQSVEMMREGHLHHIQPAYERCTVCHLIDTQLQTLYFVPLAHILIKYSFNSLQQFLEAYCYSYLTSLSHFGYLIHIYDNLFRLIQTHQAPLAHLETPSPLRLARALLSHLYSLCGCAWLTWPTWLMQLACFLYKYVLRTYIQLFIYLFVHFSYLLIYIYIDIVYFYYYYCHFILLLSLLELFFLPFVFIIFIIIKSIIILLILLILFLLLQYIFYFHFYFQNTFLLIFILFTRLFR